MTELIGVSATDSEILIYWFFPLTTKEYWEVMKRRKGSEMLAESPVLCSTIGQSVSAKTEGFSHHPRVLTF